MPENFLLTRLKLLKTPKNDSGSPKDQKIAANPMPQDLS